MKFFLLTALCAFTVGISQGQTLESVVTAGNYTTKNVWIGMAPDASVTENGLNLSGKLKLISYSTAYTTGTDANQPTIYRSGTRAGAYPFNNYDNLIFQAGIQSRDILFVTGATPNPQMIVTGTGNVGIGTLTTGTNKLAVEGTIAARRVKVTQAATWPDFVFEPEYKLPSLAELEAYIKANKHLPEVPSAAEVAKDGQDVGEMNRVLLQKIEELTLHLIEQEKRNTVQEERIRLMAEEIEKLKSK
ncbi:hypothetical protein [Chitinophaga ginsengisoli]|uniref:Endosialidase-like protein n=1 Tax=Chitinophaga ginsengisoli TaxID=363837 RepID=A0A2P8GKR2_9BACT|nr:hypothetical protein [Chitinophaga ginsengisoli]PSL34557.1 hypothetical protein CLV42_102129 [Chitinophaga ginsengisoli]